MSEAAAPESPPPPEEHEAGPALLEGGLHPAVLILWPLSQAVPLGLLLLAGTVSTRFAGGVLLAVLAASVVRWRRFRWRVDGGSLVIEQGLLARRVRTLPLARIQRVDVVRRLRHRLLGVAELQIEAIGASSAEGELDALSVAEAERLRGALLGRSGLAREPTAAETLVATRPGLLLVAGLTGGRVGVLAALLGGADQLLGERLLRFVGGLPAEVGLRGTLAAAAFVLLAAFVISVLATVVVSWDFTLRRDGERLLVNRGLLARREETVPLRRVQGLRVEENLLRRVFGLASVSADLAGGSGSSGGRDRGTLLPIGPRSQALALVEEVLAVGALSAAALTPVPSAARRRRITRAAAAVAAATALAVAAAGSPGWWALALSAPGLGAALAAHRALGRARVGEVLIARSGLLVRRTSFVPVGRLQSLASTASPAQRVAGLATVDLQIARSPGSGRGHRWIDMQAAAADAVLRQLSEELSRPLPP